MRRIPFMTKRGARPSISVRARGLLAALAILFAVTLFAAPATAFNENVVLPCVLQRALAMFTCKPVEEFRFMGLREGIYVFNAHFGPRFVEFYVQLFDDFAIFTSKAWQGRMSSARLIYDYTNGCVTASIEPPSCSFVREAKCCGG